MIQIFRPAERVDEIKEYYFSGKLRQIAEMNSRGADVISLAVGGPDRDPDPQVVDTLCAAAARHGASGYQSYQGLPELRRAFARWYSRHYGVTLDPDREVLPLIGSKEGVLHVSLALLNPGDAALVPDPGYPTYTSVTRIIGAHPVAYPLDESSGWQPDFNALEALVAANPRIRLMWVNYPNMPTGAPAQPGLFSRLVDFGRRHSIIIAHDNPYSFILNPSPASILATEGARDVCLELNSLSKSHNMPGWRVGMLAANPVITGWVLKIKSNIDSGQYRPVMEAAARALDLGPEWYAALNDGYRRRRAKAEALLSSLGCTFDASQQGLFVWARIPEAEESATALTERVLRDARVFIVPGSVFGSRGSRYVRVSLCATEEQFDRALHRIHQMTDTQ